MLCDGEIRTSQYEDQQGVTRYSWELRANIVKFLSQPGEKGQTPDFDAIGAPAGNGGDAVAEDDIPF